MDTQKELPLSAARLSRVTISRLFSTGDYSHARYELTVEIPPGCDPGRVLADLDTMMEKLNPRPPASPGELLHAMSVLKRQPPQEPTPEQIAAHQALDDPFADSPSEVYSREMARRAESSEVVAEHERWKAGREKALAAFSAFVGTGTGGKVSVMDMGPLEELKA